MLSLRPYRPTTEQERAPAVPVQAVRRFTRAADIPDPDLAMADLSFVVHKHAARRLHYDFRLELDGVLKSWALARGPSLVAGERRLAVAVENHRLDYAAYEGVIPAGSYGAGAVLVWDQGTWRPEGDAAADLAAGSLGFCLHGEKLAGAWRLVRMKGRGAPRESWLLIKARDAAARDPSAPDILVERPLSVASGRAIEDLV